MRGVPQVWDSAKELAPLALQSCSAGGAGAGNDGEAYIHALQDANVSALRAGIDAYRLVFQDDRVRGRVGRVRVWFASASVCVPACCVCTRRAQLLHWIAGEEALNAASAPPATGPAPPEGTFVPPTPAPEFALSLMHKACQGDIGGLRGSLRVRGPCGHVPPGRTPTWRA